MAIDRILCLDWSRMTRSEIIITGYEKVDMCSCPPSRQFVGRLMVMRGAHHCKECFLYRPIRRSTDVYG